MTRYLSAICLLLCLLSGVVALYVFRESVVDGIDALMMSVSLPVAGALFVLMFMIGEALLIPSSLLMILGGAVFGFTWGLALNLVGFSCGAVLAFLLARSQFRWIVLKILPPGIASFIQTKAVGSWQTVAFVRLVGIIPGVLLNYALGLTSLRFSTYLWASLAFTLPSGLILTYAGVAGEDFIRNGEMSNLLLAVTLLALTTAGAAQLRRRQSRLPNHDA